MLFYAASGKQCGRDRGEPADGIGTGCFRLAQDEHIYGASLSHRHVGVDANYLPRYTRFDVVLSDAVSLARLDRAQLWKAHMAIASNVKIKHLILAAKQLHLEHIARPNDVVVRRPAY